MKRLLILGASGGQPAYDGIGPEWEVWGCNSLWRQATDRAGNFRAHRWYEMHPRWPSTPAEIDAVIRCPIPIYVLDKTEWPDAPNAVEYPIEEVAKINDYFASTFAYQVALGIHEGFSRISLWGVNLNLGTTRERTVERMNLEWWLGYAEGRGITLQLQHDSVLCRRPHRYGYEYAEEINAVNDEILLLDCVIHQDADAGRLNWMAKP